ncbi:MAG: bifunctional hydroxymethylpyrimidine kinase/phosphomethylpyrimidine kinase [bacterium]|nr:bifunctional hydroxymethylpyrimidine kinase/phosphomethylpyrimidine kinase [bacterium]
MNSGRRRALTIAGSDSGGGAGVQADLKTFGSFGVFGMTALTAVTAQNSRSVLAVAGLDPELVRLQIRAVRTDMGADGVKTGMLFNADIVRAVAEELRLLKNIPVVVDPVMVAKDGSPLLDASAVGAVISDLLPCASLVTPNTEEAESLSGVPIRSGADMEEAARVIRRMGPAAVLVKGGHLPGDPVDVLFDGKTVTRYPGKRIGSRPAHGTGCTLSAAILCGLVKGSPLDAAVRDAKAYLENAIRSGFSTGGSVVLDHLAACPGSRP